MGKVEFEGHQALNQKRSSVLRETHKAPGKQHGVGREGSEQ